MKITITVDCTPEEARSFLGAPDLSAVQSQMMSAFQEHMQHNLSADPDAAMKAWFGPALQGFADLQKSYLQAAGKPAGKADK